MRPPVVRPLSRAPAGAALVAIVAASAAAQPAQPAQPARPARPPTDLVSPYAGAPQTPASAPARRRPPPEGASSDVVTHTVEALIADKSGDIEAALRMYRRVTELQPHANTHYNLADVYRRVEDYRRAIEQYRKVVELATTPGERAEAERLIAELKAAPGLVVIDGEEPDAVVYVNGKLVGPSPVLLALPEGRYDTERIGPRTFRSATFRVTVGSQQHVNLATKIEQPGNVVLTTNLDRSMSWIDEASGQRFSMPGRLQLPPGRYATVPLGDVTCAPITFEVPRGDAVIYVRVDQTGAPRPRSGPQPSDRHRAACVPIKTSQHVLRLPS